MSDKTFTVADRIPDDQCYTIKEFADELGLGPQRTKQLIDRAVELKLVQPLIKSGGKGLPSLYAPQMVDGVKEAFLSGKLGKVRKTHGKVNRKNAALVIEVPVYDREVAELLQKMLNGPDGIQTYLRQKLDEVVKPAQSKLNALKKQYESEMEQLLRNLGQSEDSK